MKRLFCLFLSFILLVMPVMALDDLDEGMEVARIIAEGQIIKDIDSSLVGADPTTLDIKAKSYILVDQKSGKVLAANNENEHMPCASITKVMLLLLVMEDLDSGKISMQDKVVASEHASSMGGAQIWLEPGEEMSVYDLLKAVAISSANDASVALGEHIAGSEDGVVVRMNQRAKELGMNDTTFKNCTGLDDPEHLTTALDISKMSCELLKHEKIFEFSTVWMDSLRNGETELVNTNKLIRFYKGAKGLKTGTTAGAKYCLAACAERDGLMLLSVNLGSETTDDRFLSARRLLDYGFANFENYTPEIDLSQSGGVKVSHGVSNEVLPKLSDISPILIEKGQSKEIKTEISLIDSVSAPVNSDTVLGQVKLVLGDEVLATYPIYPKESVEKMTFSAAFLRLFKSFVKMA